MELFTIDTAGTSADTHHSIRKTLLPSYQKILNCSSLSEKAVSKQRVALNLPEESDDEGGDYGGLPPPEQDIFEILQDAGSSNTVGKQKRSDQLSLNFLRNNRLSGTAAVKELAATNVEQHMKAAVITPATEKQQNLTTLSMTERQIKEQNRKERAKTKGANWFNLPAPEITEEVKNELELIRMRSVLDPKHFYKRSEMKTLPKYFQIGKVIASPLDYYNERGTKKTKAKTLVDELLEDAEFQKYNKKKYAEALEKRKKKAYHKAAIKMKKLKKKKK
ncbi:deoxynucleotidyltransferase terminal-interacting protein 2 [Malaya genurostris]|uniref:deoxynucleotidyltransferase terminal-interacting protein 2 n=1 Tax=Malaya genurostris TaxID=325434 RepID=UPI0026F3E9A0|nr:deoxynucleotidyltransferase terminal-interacting protein 2 [Malaya genurostris]